MGSWKKREKRGELPQGVAVHVQAGNPRHKTCGTCGEYKFVTLKGWYLPKLICIAHIGNNRPVA